MATKTISKYSKIYWKLIKFAATQETTYRFGFFLEIFVEAAYILVTLLGTGVLFWNVSDIAGWNFHQMLVLLGLNAIFAETILGLIFVFNLRSLPQQINKGSLDMVLVKPLNSQFVVSLWRPYFAFIPSLIPGVLMIYFGFKLGGFRFDPWSLLPFLIIFSAGLVIAYAVGMLLSTLSVWLINATPLPMVAENIIFMAKIPYSVYTGGLRIVFLLFVPLAFMVSFPAQTLLGGSQWWWPAVAAGLAALFLKTSSLFWNFALKHYSGASS